MQGCVQYNTCVQPLFALGWSDFEVGLASMLSAWKTRTTTYPVYISWAASNATHIVASCERRAQDFGECTIELVGSSRNQVERALNRARESHSILFYPGGRGDPGLNKAVPGGVDQPLCCVGRRFGLNKCRRILAGLLDCFAALKRGGSVEARRLSSPVVGSHQLSLELHVTRNSGARGPNLSPGWNPLTPLVSQQEQRRLMPLHH